MTTHNETGPMRVYVFEAMDATGQEIRDEISAHSSEEAQSLIRQMGYFVTKIAPARPKRTGEQLAGRPPSKPATYYIIRYAPTILVAIVCFVIGLLIGLAI